MTDPSVICELCASIGGEPIWENALCRVVSNADPDYPGFCRVILNRHEREMTDLTEDEQREMMRIVFAVESTLRRLINPDKINLASLGNMVAHVHWHVIPRWREDRCFPNSIWGATQRTVTSVPTVVDLLLLKAELAAQLGESTPASRKSS
jgi:diadenosine tetraphosphate (Ap4A) HIT family hydrolase